uniref:Uncharacterized protein n=1 Tax=Timema monikensis TaxID=170555 RepID=A0A7R9EEN6_9NEOP|nr:unnamed protein product [Timema monikensis]
MSSHHRFSSWEVSTNRGWAPRGVGPGQMLWKTPSLLWIEFLCDASTRHGCRNRQAFHETKSGNGLRKHVGSLEQGVKSCLEERKVDLCQGEPTHLLIYLRSHHSQNR